MTKCPTGYEKTTKFKNFTNDDNSSLLMSTNRNNNSFISLDVKEAGVSANELTEAGKTITQI